MAKEQIEMQNGMQRKENCQNKKSQNNNNNTRVRMERQILILGRGGFALQKLHLDYTVNIMFDIPTHIGTWSRCDGILCDFSAQTDVLLAHG